MIETVHIAVCRKPLQENYVENVLLHGQAGININGDDTSRKPSASTGWCVSSVLTGTMTDDWKKGRWPSNVMTDGSYSINDILDDSARYFWRLTK